MAKRPIVIDLVDSDDEVDEEIAVPRRKRATRPCVAREPPPALYRASIKETADPAGDASAGAADGLDDNILQRIKKCLARANHPGTPESEAKAALHIATRLMSQYNVSQAEVLAHESAEARQQYAGQSSVAIHRTDNDPRKPVLHQMYVDNLISAIKRFFVCECYTSKRRSSLEVVFYGIASNTTAAAHSFEMVYNQVNDWARMYKGGNPRNSYLLGISESLVKMARQERTAEEERARRAEAEALAAKVKEEEAERQAQLDRLAPLPRSPSPLHAKVEPMVEPEIKQEPDEADEDRNDPSMSDASSSTSEPDFDGIGFPDGMDQSDDDMDPGVQIEPDFDFDEGAPINPFNDFEDELQRFIKPDPEALAASNPWSAPVVKPEPGTHDKEYSGTPAVNDDTANAGSVKAEPAATEADAIKQEESKADDGPQWASHMQLVAFRDTASKIAEEYLESTLGKKLRKGRQRTSHIRDSHAYGKGRADGKKIDVRRRRIAE